MRGRKLDPFEVWDVSKWSPSGEEPRGKRKKVWVENPEKEPWLRKEAIKTRPSELAIEATMLRIARAAELPAPVSSPCRWTQDGREVRGIVIRSFLTGPSTALTEGAELLRGADASYGAEDRAGHTLDLVRSALKVAEKGKPTKRLRAAFLRMLLFDAWVGNGDLHPENWGVLQRADGDLELAPVYDVAACMGAELGDGAPLLDWRRRTLAALQDYLLRCPSGFGDGNRLIKQVAVLEEIRRWQDWKMHARELVGRFGEIWAGPLWGYLDSVPEDWLSRRRKMLVQELRAIRLAWLRSWL